MPETTTKPCGATVGPDTDDPYIYVCNRTQPHTNLHADIGPDGNVIATWCSCADCKNCPEDIS
jgi:hypothetical protein